MKKTVMIAFVLFALVTLLATAGLAQEAKKEAEVKKVTHEFVGDKKCKTCHKAEHASWLETKHAKAFDVLSDEEKKKKECVVCHVTGTNAAGELLEGVQCEACHGAGADYKSPKIMSKKKWAADPDAHKKMAIEAGLNYPTEETCVRCHKKEGNPNFKPFDFAKRKSEVHAMAADTTK